MEEKRLSFRGGWFSEARDWNVLSQMDILRSSLRSRLLRGCREVKATVEQRPPLRGLSSMQMTDTQ